MTPNNVEVLPQQTVFNYNKRNTHLTVMEESRTGGRFFFYSIPLETLSGESIAVNFHCICVLLLLVNTGTCNILTKKLTICKKRIGLITQSL